MITHIFNSSIVSGPEMLVIPALKKIGEPVSIVFLTETRLITESLDPVDYARSFGYDVYTVPVAGRWDRKAFLELRKVLDKINPRIVHAHDVKASLYLYEAKKLRSGMASKTVSTHHGASYRKGKIRLYEEFYVRFVLPHFDQVLSVCEIDRHSIIKRGVPPEKVFTHLNGTDRPKVASVERARAQELIRNQWRANMPGLPDSKNAIYLGTVARLSSEKRHDRMIQILDRLKKVETPGSPIKVLLCFGTGSLESKLLKLVRKLKLEDRVFFMGYSKTISTEMAGFDALLCLSDGEGIPINLLEAGWAGTPVISTRVGGIPDLIPSSEFGYLLEKRNSNAVLAEYFKKILRDPRKLREVGLAYQARVIESFSHEAWITRLRELYAGIH